MKDVIADGVALKLSAEMTELEQGLNAAFAEVNKTARRMEGRMSKVSQSFKQVGNAMASIGSKLSLGITAPFAAAGAGMLKVASDAQEMRGKFNAVFKDSAADVEAWAKEFGGSIGRSRFELMEMASGVQDMFVPMGFARNEAAGLSKSLSELAVDVASFNNESDTQAMERFKSALVGNHEAVRAYGIVITETTLKEELARIGVDKLTGAALEQAKVQARLNLIQKGSSDAMGDAARTADSTANSMKALKAKFTDMVTELGERFLPIADKMIAWATDTVTWFAELDSTTQALTVGVAALTAALGPTLMILGKVVSMLGLLLSPIGLTVAAVAGLSLAFVMFRDEIMEVLKPLGEIFQKYIAEPFLWAVGKIKGMWGDFISYLTEKAANVADLLGFDEQAEKMRSFADAAREWGAGNIDIAGYVIGEVEGLAGSAADVISERFKGVVSDAKGWFADLAGTGLDQMENVGVDTGRSTSGGKTKVPASTEIKDKTTVAAETTKTAWTQVADGIRRDFTAVSVDVRDVFGSLGDSIKNIFSNALNGILNNVVGGLMKSLMSGLTGGIFGMPLAFAGGGRLSAGVPTLVGERGPELIVPSRTATVMNNHDSQRAFGGASVTQNISINNDLVPAPTISAMIENAIAASVPAIKQAVLDDMARA